MRWVTDILSRSTSGLTGPYGEDPWSELRLNRTMRSRAQDEDSMQGRGNRGFLRRQCADLYRTSGLARAGVNRIADYSTTATVYPVTADDAWNERAFAYFRDWSKIADYRQRPGVDLAKLVHMGHVADHITGECYFLLTDHGQLQPIEADRIQTPAKFEKDPAIVDGIRVSPTGIVTAYYVCNRGLSGTVDTTQFRRVAAQNMIHVSDPWRVDMLHGVPRLHAAVAKIADYDETDEAMRNKVKNEARNFYKTEKNMALGGPRSGTVGTGDNRYRMIETKIGQVWEGGNIELVESKSPNAGYTGHMVEEAKAVAASLDVPYEYLMMIFTAGSYNAQKGARLAFADTCRRRADWMNRVMVSRVYTWRIAKAIKEGDLPPAPVSVAPNGVHRSEFYLAEYAMPRFVDIDLGRDVSAKSAAWAAGQQSLRDQREHPYSVLQDKAADILKADNIADVLNGKLKTGKVSWQHLINAGVPGLTIEPVNDDAAGDDDKGDPVNE